MKHVAAPNLEAQLFRLATLTELLKRARHAETEQELGFIMVNETHALVPYRQAMLWRCDEQGGGKLVAISGAAVVESNAPLSLWLNRALRRLAETASERPKSVGGTTLSGPLGQEWAEWLPAHGLQVPLILKLGQRPFGILLLAREQAWSDSEAHILQEAADGFAHAWAHVLRRKKRPLLDWMRSRRTILKLGVGLLAIAALCFPVTLSTLAPAEVIAFKPTIVRAPLDGVVDHFLIAPNAQVQQGQPILELDPRAIQNKADVAGKELAVAEAEYRQAAQEAVFDDKSRSKLAVLKGRMDQRHADLAYAQSLLDRVHVTAARSGLALFEDPNDWIGKPVTIGERLLEIADPDDAIIEIWLPVADAITLQLGTAVELFLNVAPDAPLRAKLYQASYEASLSPANLLGYRLKAQFDAGSRMPRIGLRGTAKLYGEKVSLFYYLARRPLAAARQFLGW